MLKCMQQFNVNTELKGNRMEKNHEWFKRKCPMDMSEVVTLGSFTIKPSSAFMFTSWCGKCLLPSLWYKHLPLVLCFEQ